MHSAGLYHRANNVQRQDAQQILQEYAKVFQWRADGDDNLLDIGTGSGNVLMDFIYPLMPPNFKRLVGCDISRNMIHYAQGTYGNCERVKFELLDIRTPNLPTDLKEQFDHITSFYCLHWVQNQRTALSNIYKLLRPEGGDCLLIFLASHLIFDVYKTMAAKPKWKQYMLDADSFISPLQTSTDPLFEYRKLLQQTGFRTNIVEVRSKVYEYEGLDAFKDNMGAVSPFLERIPKAQHENYWIDMVDVVDSMGMRERDEYIDDYNFIMPYKLLIAYARKSVN